MTDFDKFDYPLYESIANTAFSNKVGAAIIAHRGIHGPDSSDENSVESLELSVRFGVAIEIDIFFTPQGKNVLLHGPFSTRAAQQVMQTLDEKKSLCTLEAAFEVINGQIPLLLDLKHLSLATPQAIDRCINSVENYKGPLFIAAFDRNVLSFKKRLPNIPVGLITFGLDLSVKPYRHYDFVDVQKDAYALRRSWYAPQQTKLLWTYSTLQKALDAVGGTQYIGVCDISEQEATSA